MLQAIKMLHESGFLLPHFELGNFRISKGHIVKIIDLSNAVKITQPKYREIGP